MSSFGPSRLRAWAARAVVLFLAVYVLGLLRVPTLIPYVAVLLVVVADLARALLAGRQDRKGRRQSADVTRVDISRQNK